MLGRQLGDGLGWSLSLRDGKAERMQVWVSEDSQSLSTGTCLMLQKQAMSMYACMYEVYLRGTLHCRHGPAGPPGRECALGGEPMISSKLPQLYARFTVHPCVTSGPSANLHVLPLTHTMMCAFPCAHAAKRV